MIEKLPDSFTPRRNQWDEIVDHPSPLDILAKLNEVIEAVNRMAPHHASISEDDLKDYPFQALLEP